jgi:hypothetical protein
MHVVSGSLSLPALGCFSPFPHGTRSLSVTRESLALEGGPPGFTPDYSGRALLRNSTTHRSSSSPTGLSPSLAGRSKPLRLTSRYASVGPTTPRPQGPRFGLYPVRSPLLGASRLISLSTRYLDVSVPWVRSPFGVTAIPDGRVSPFGNPGIKACVPLPQAYRSLPRPSSPSCAKASSTCIRSLDYKHVIQQSTRDLQRVSDLSVWRLRAFRRNRVTSVIRYPTNTTIFRCQTACGHVRPRAHAPAEKMSQREIAQHARRATIR